VTSENRRENANHHAVETKGIATLSPVEIGRQSERSKIRREYVRV